MSNSISRYKDRLEDYRLHLGDLRDLSYEGSVGRAKRDATFTRAIELLSPVVQEVLGEFNEAMLGDTGTVEWRPVDSDGDDGLISMWLLSWPLQRAGRRRPHGVWEKDTEPTQPPVLKETKQGSIDPIIVRAFLPKDGVTGWLHGHIGGGYHSPNSMWPLNVVTPDDAERQGIIIWAIADGELHRCAYELADAPMSLFPDTTACGSEH